MRQYSALTKLQTFIEQNGKKLKAFEIRLELLKIRAQKIKDELKELRRHSNG